MKGRKKAEFKADWPSVAEDLLYVVWENILFTQKTFTAEQGT